MKRYITALLILAIASMNAWAIMDNDGGCQNLQNFFRNVEGYGRVGYSIGGQGYAH